MKPLATTLLRSAFCLLFALSVSQAQAATAMIAAGFGSSLFLNSDGSVWGAGAVPIGAPSVTSPVRLFALSNVSAIASGGFTEFALLADGTLWGAGANGSGVLGDGTTQSRFEAQQVPGLTGVKAVSVGNHVLALKTDGTVWAWGNNRFGQLGDGTQTDRYVPAQVSGLPNISSVSASEGGSLALSADGTVWVWGSTGSGASGNGLVNDPYHLTPTQVHNLDRIVAIAAGSNHHMALRDDGTVWSWGAGNLGQNGNGLLTDLTLPVQVPGLDHVVAIESRSWGSSFAVKADGTVWGWGNNGSGELGVGGITYSASPIQVPGLSGIVAISAANDHALAMRRDGTVFAWGSNSTGQLGDNGLQDHTQARAVVGPGGTGQLDLLQPAPVSFNKLPQAMINVNTSSGVPPLTVQATAVNATDADGTVVNFIWQSSDGQQATGPSATFLFTQAGSYGIDLLIEDNAGGRGHALMPVLVAPVPVSSSATPKAAINWNGSIALANDSRILTWGQSWMIGLYNPVAHAPLAVANSYPIANGVSGAVDFALGGAHVLVLLADGSVLGWGSNGTGQVGTSNSSNGQPQTLSNLPPVQALAAGANHSLALTRDGRVYAWGNNTNGELGLGDKQTRFVPTEVTALSDVTAIGADASFSVALKTDGTVWVWGQDLCFQFGAGTPSLPSLPIQIPGLSNVAKIFTAGCSLFARKTDGTVWVVGLLPMNIPGDPGPISGVRHLSLFEGFVQIAGGGQHIVALKADGTVWLGGLQSSMALGFQDGGDIAGLKQLPGVSDAVAVAAHVVNTMVLRKDGTVLSWGSNLSGQLGDGTLATRQTPVLVVSETTSGFLDLIPDIAFEMPPGVGVPFFVVASGGITSTTATVGTTTKFNAPDVGKSGAVFVTAMVPPGSLVPAQSPLSASSAIRPVAFAALTPNSFALIQLTSSGWQPVANGQLIPYASGVLGDQLAAQTILNNTDTTNLKGAQFCLGYGASAEQMISAGTMRVIASIPDPNAPGTAAPSCIVGGAPVSYSLPVQQGWNLLGNSLNQSLSVASLYGDSNVVTTVWKWDATRSAWQFYAPSMDAAALQTYTASKGYGVLSEIKPGEGYWVNARVQPTLGTQSGDSYILTAAGLVKGWNLVATGDDVSPSAFNTNLKSSLPGTGVTTLWAWDNTSSKWYFYAPSLEDQGGTALSGYIASKAYLDFTLSNKTLGNGTGFWVNR